MREGFAIITQELFSIVSNMRGDNIHSQVQIENFSKRKTDMIEQLSNVDKLQEALLIRIDIEFFLRKIFKKDLESPMNYSSDLIFLMKLLQWSIKYLNFENKNKINNFGFTFETRWALENILNMYALSYYTVEDVSFKWANKDMFKKLLFECLEMSS